MEKDDNERLKIAFHESGHALWYLKHNVPVNEISIIPQGKSLGRVNFKKSESLPKNDRLAGILCGFMAECKFTGQRFDLSILNGQSDQAAILKELGFYYLHPEDGKRLYLEVKNKAFRFINDHWDNISWLAELLMKYGEIDGKNLNRLFSPLDQLDKTLLNLDSKFLSRKSYKKPEFNKSDKIRSLKTNSKNPPGILAGDLSAICESGKVLYLKSLGIRLRGISVMSNRDESGKLIEGKKKIPTHGKSSEVMTNFLGRIYYDKDSLTNDENLVLSLIGGIAETRFLNFSVNDYLKREKRWRIEFLDLESIIFDKTANKAFNFVNSSWEDITWLAEMLRKNGDYLNESKLKILIGDL